MALVVHPAELLEADVVRAWASLAVDALGAARATLDSANVFPVPDGDTGTNMFLTLREGAHAVRAEPAGADGARLLRLLARGTLLGARGNSGVILSEWLRGLAAAATRREPLEVALDAAARTARRAVARPAPGTILTAAEAAAGAARDESARGGAERDGDLVPGGPAAYRQGLLDAARRGARHAALASAETLAPLREAGVLDSGAGGLLLVLHALAEAHRAVGTAGGMSEVPGSMAPVTLDIDLRPPAGGVVPAGPHDDELELMFVLHRPAGAGEYATGAVADALRRDLGAVGGSVVVVGGADPSGAALADAEPDADTLWQAHVHTVDLDAALDVARRWAARATVSHVHVRHLATRDAPGPGWGVVAATTAPGLAGELARTGAVVLVGLDAPVTAEDLAVAAVGSPQPQVLVLPGPALDAGPGVAAALDAHRAGEPEDEHVVVVLDAPTDAHLVVALAALAEADQAPGGAPEALRAALDGLRVVRVGADRGAGALAALLEGSAGADVVTVLVDAGVGDVAVDAVVRAAEAAGAEALVLPTGRPGDEIEIATEVDG
ncbi:hypothetical protein GCM10009809_00390 [Isoptericola hypogeus]|uniref:DhaL domain-containing protein n=1 Tax=Isoptericola hypogeus TaxID=300179 RepID=A0ABN2IMH9_9MICO